MLELNKIYNMDCLEGMKLIDDNSIDLIVTDPPYGIGASIVTRGGTSGGKSVTKSKKYKKFDWDKSIPTKEIFDEMFRISKNQIIFGGNYFVEYLYNSPCWIVWDKKNGNNTYADCELAWTSFKTAVRKIDYRWHGMLQENMKNKEARYHPTQKPVDLFVRILKNYSKETDIICDPFMGSGTTALASIKFKRQFIGFEKIKDYCDIANQRIEDELSQTKLF